MVRKTKSQKTLEKIAQKIKLTTLDISYKAKTGHVGSALSICDILAVIYFNVISIDKKTLDNPERDRFILSKGHAAAALYATLYEKEIISKKELESFGHDNGLCEHPEMHEKGVEMSTGSLGHGISFGAGVALGLKKKNLSGKVVVLISDGECGEGAIWEAALLAPKLGLSNLTVVIDNNGWQCFDKVKKINNLYPLRKKWESFGWKTIEVDGHSIPKLVTAFSKTNAKPTVIIANTITGKNISAIEDSQIAHYKVFSDEEYTIARKELIS